jgi:PKD repeat protein
MKRLTLSIFILFCFAGIKISAQTNHVSVMQEQNTFYSNYNFTNDHQWDSLDAVLNPVQIKKVLPFHKSNCQLNKMVYGWYPYWNGSVYNNFQWNLLSRLSYCFYDVDYTTGNATSTHNWSTAAVIDSALANGVKVDLCVDLFSNLTSFLGNTTAQNTLISNIINMVQSRGAHGVCIDFEGMTSSNQAGFATFMTNLCTQMHSSIPGSKVSIATYAGSTSAFDLPTLNQYVDYFVVMGYDYYYGGSSTAGSTDPLYSSGLSLTKTVTTYLSNGVTPSKLIMGLPYYGFTWPVSSTAIHGSTTGTGSSVLFKTAITNSSGYYSNPIWDSASYSPYYNYTASSTQYQCWVDNYYCSGERIDMVNQRGIGGIGIWALGYDDGYTGYWNNIRDKLSTCAITQCSDTIYDMGGPSNNYSSNENYTYTIAPDGASSVKLTFTSFSVTNDTLWLYDGPSTSSNLIGTYTLTNSPGVITSTGSSLTLKFRSGTSTNSTGWRAVWQCIVDNIAPTTAINVTGNWQTQNFTTNFTDADNNNGSGIEKRYYSVNDLNGTNWSANAQNGFFRDDFNTLNSTVWTIPASSGIWQVTGGNLVQKDTTVSNTNIYAALNQNLSNRYIYHFNAKIESAVYGANQRRFGFHFFSDDASQTNRGNSYFIFFRQESSQLEFYKVVNNTFTQTAVVTGIVTTPGQWYDFKIIFDRTTGKISVYRDNNFLGSWTDPTPLTNSGGYISFRTGNCKATINDIKVYRSRNATAIISVGAASTNDIRYQNPDPLTASGKILSLVNDLAGNISTIVTKDINVDWTPPLTISNVNDGITADIDTTTLVNSISANFKKSTDPNSGIDHYMYCFGTTPGGAELTGWTSNGTDTTATRSGFTLVNGQHYYFSVYAINGAGLISDTTISDGVLVISAPVAGFSALPNAVCEGDTIHFTNTSTNASSYLWSFQGGTPVSSTLANPDVIYDTAGTFNVQLIATGIGGKDTLLQSQYITANPKAHAAFSANDTLVYLPSANVVFFNTSTDATSYLWDYGDGVTSTDQNPWHAYDTSGIYTVTLIAYNSQCGNDTLVMNNYIHVDTGVGISELNEINDISVFPNPATENIEVVFNLKSNVQIEISMIDKTGKQISVMSKTQIAKGNFKKEINLQQLHLSHGSYMLRISEGKKNYYKEVIVL